MSTPFKKAVRDYFDRRRLTEERLQRLMALEQEHGGGLPRTGNQRRQGLRYLLFALAGISAGFALMLLVMNLQSTPVPQLIAADVAENHINLKPADIETDNLDDIRRFFTGLDFLPIQSRLIAANEWELTGGRYCSIQSTSAAQLRIRHTQSNKMQTLYQVVYQKERFKDLPSMEEGEEPLVVSARGLRVKIWVERGILFAMTDE